MSAAVPLPSSRLLSTASVIAAVLLVCSAVGLALWQDALHRAEREQQTAAQARVVAASVTAALSFDDAATAQEYLNALASNPDLEAAAVFEPNGKVLAHFLRAAAKPIPKLPSARISTSDFRIAVAVPAVQGARVLGSVYLRTAREPESRRWALYLPIILLGSMAALLVGVLASAQSSLAETNAELLVQMEERARAEEALRQSHKMEAIGQLSGGIAHDFNNLLSVMQGNLQMMKRRLAQGRIDVAAYADMAIEALYRAAALTQRLLAFSRDQPLSPRPVDLSEVVRNVLDLVHNLAGETIEVTTDLSAHWWTVCDVNQMENVILNLAINARDAMPEGGVLKFTTRDLRIVPTGGRDTKIPPGNYVEFRISDTGTGMSREVLDRAVDPFFTTKPTGRGTGLGLSVTFGYIRQSEGHMRIESALGEGTTIVILMPAREKPVEAASEAAA